LFGFYRAALSFGLQDILVSTESLYFSALHDSLVFTEPHNLSELHDSSVSTEPHNLSELHDSSVSTEPRYLSELHDSLFRPSRFIVRRFTTVYFYRGALSLGTSQ
jgi:hypothetical protein